MNTIHHNTVYKLTSAELAHLTSFVTETLAMEMDSYKPFTAAELWNIQRRRRSFVQRRFNA